MILEKIKSRLEEIELDCPQFIVPKFIIINPKTERKVYIEGELKKSEDLSFHLGIPIILSKEVSEDDIIIGV